MKKVFSNLSEAAEHLNGVLKTSKSYGHDTCVVDLGCLEAVMDDYNYFTSSDIGKDNK